MEAFVNGRWYPVTDLTSQGVTVKMDGHYMFAKFEVLRLRFPTESMGWCYVKVEKDYVSKLDM